jgi:DNA-binding GntR family transcriptional regulator
MATAQSSNALLRRKNLSEQIYEILEKRIIEGDMLPGTRLAEEAIADEFGVSRSPVREAITELELIGLAERSRGRDRRVVVPTAKFISDTYDTWTILQTGRCYQSSLAAPTEDHEKIRWVLDQMDKAKRRGPLAPFVKLSRQFHELLKFRCDNAQLLSVLAGFEKYGRWLSAIYFSDLDTSETSTVEHRQIAEAYINKDLLSITALMQQHISRQRDRILASLKNDEPAAPPRDAL